MSIHSEPTVSGQPGFPPPPPPAAPPAVPPGIAGTLGRTVAVLLPFALVPWVALQTDVGVALAVCLAGLAVYAVLATLLLRVLGVARPAVVGPLATVLAAVAQLSWAFSVLPLALGLEGDGTPEEVVGNPFGLLVATAVGATIAVLLLHIGQGVAWPLPVALVGLLVVVPVASVVVGTVVDDRADDEALRADLEASGQPYLLPDLDGLEPTSVTADRDFQEATGLDPRITISYARDSGSDGYQAPVAYVTVRDLPSGALCEALTVLPDDACTEADGVAAVDDGFRPQVAVDHGDAMLVLEPGVGDDALTSAELQELAPALQDAPEVGVEGLVDVD